MNACKEAATVDAGGRGIVLCCRRWKRDGSVNWMELRAAMRNIRNNSPLEKDVLRRIMGGESVETTLAEFFIP